MVEIGKLNKLKILREVEFGVYLDGGELGDILLPGKYVPECSEVDDIVEVFVFLDSEDRLIAIDKKPYAMVGDAAFLEVVAVNSVGAFLDWGLSKDLMVPFREQKPKMRLGDSYVVFVYLDELTQRIAASARLDKYIGKKKLQFTEGQEVELIIVDHTDLGWKAIVDSDKWGVLYDNEVFQKLKVGQKINGFIKKVRPDGKLDLSLEKSGYKRIGNVSDNIIEKLKEEKGFLAINSKSSPETIYSFFGVSKKAFKMAIGDLYKKRIISITEDGIKLNS